MNLIEVIETAARKLEATGVVFGQGTTNAFDEAAWLALWRLDLPVDSLDVNAERSVSVAERGTIDMLIDKRIRSRLPAAYLTNEAWLQGVPFYVDERVIIPRSFIAELLAEGTIDSWLSSDTHSLLDLCTGSGCLAILAAMTYPEMAVDAADISPEALEVARINVDKHRLGTRIQLIESDGLQSVQGPYDLILCNPPYVNAHSMAGLPNEFRAEPKLALWGGEDGMDFVRPLMRQAYNVMRPNGVLVLEIGNERANFEAAFPQLEVVWLETSAGEDQVLLVTREALRR